MKETAARSRCSLINTLILSPRRLCLTRCLSVCLSVCLSDSLSQSKYSLDPHKFYQRCVLGQEKYKHILEVTHAILLIVYD